MVGAVPRRSVPVAIPRIVTGQQPIQGSQEVLIRPGARLDHDDARRRVRHEHRQEPVAGPRRGPGERLALAGQVDECGTVPGPDRDLAGLYGKMLRIASRSRPSPPPTGADS